MVQLNEGSLAQRLGWRVMETDVVIFEARCQNNREENLLGHVDATSLVSSFTNSTKFSASMVQSVRPTGPMGIISSKFGEGTLHEVTATHC